MTELRLQITSDGWRCPMTVRSRVLHQPPRRMTRHGMTPTAAIRPRLPPTLVFSWVINNDFPRHYVFFHKKNRASLLSRALARFDLLGESERSWSTTLARQGTREMSEATMRMILRIAALLATAIVLGSHPTTAKIQPDGACPLFVLLPFTSTCVPLMPAVAEDRWLVCSSEGHRHILPLC